MCTDCGCGVTPALMRAARRSKALPAKTGGASRASTYQAVSQRPDALPPAHVHEPLSADGVHLHVVQHLLAANDSVAAQNRQLLNQHRVLALNLMSSPGSGKTTLLEHLLPRLAARYRVAVLVGDLQTELDADRLRARGLQAMQISTGQACHLDAAMVAEALPQLHLPELDVLFIENVGNLVCPASFDLGEHHKVALLAVTEGHDKPPKYPGLFSQADLTLITKLDFLPLIPEFSPAAAEASIRQIGNRAPVLGLSIRQPETLEPLLAWIDQAYQAQFGLLPQARTEVPA